MLLIIFSPLSNDLVGFAIFIPFVSWNAERASHHAITADQGFHAPVIIMISPTVALRDEISWFMENLNENYFIHSDF